MFSDITNHLNTARMSSMRVSIRGLRSTQKPDSNFDSDSGGVGVEVGIIKTNFFGIGVGAGVAKVNTFRSRARSD
jgi:hypothetical protein